MDCLVCNSRSAIESCAVCRTLLCEDCAVKCQMCGHVVCPQHVYTTHSGKKLCVPCQEKRRAERHARHGGADMPEESASDVAATAEGEVVAEDESAVLVASVRKPPPPWKLSLYTACAGVALALLFLAVPSIRRFPLPGGQYFPTPYLTLLVPAIAIFWSVLGMFGKEYYEDRRRCLIGLGIALASCVMLIFAVYSDPARLAERDAARVQSERDNMTPEQLKQWREQKMKKFQR